MPDSPQQEAVALWKFLESRGMKPSMRSVGETLRRHKVPCRDSQLRKWLKNFGPRPCLSTVAPGLHETSTPVAVGLQLGCTPAAASRAPELVSLVSKETTSPLPVGSDGDSPGTGSTPVKLTQSRKPSERDLAAYAILAAAYPIIAENVELAHNQTIWKQRNKHAALELVDSGRRPDQVTCLLETAYDDTLEGAEFYSRISTIAKLAEHWGALVHLNLHGVDKKKPLNHLRVL